MWVNESELISIGDFWNCPTWKIKKTELCVSLLQDAFAKSILQVNWDQSLN